MSYRQKNNLKLGLILFILFILFTWACYQLITSQLYYHITVEQYTQDNESITEAFKKESALRRHMEKSLAMEKLEAEQVQEKLLSAYHVNEKHLEQLQITKFSYNHLQDKYKRVKLEKDSLIAIIRSLQRVD